MGVSLCINNGTLITPHGALRCSVAIGEGKILALQTEEAVGLRGCAEVIDAKGKMVLPGVIDVHVHLEDVGSDGTPTADDFYDGTKSAAWGGTTCVIDFVTPDPGEGLTAALRRRRSAAERGSVVDFGFHMCITQNWRDEIDEVEEVLRSGVPSFKAFTTYQGLE
ncbi:MAG TPA: amidohydrolase family protein, partial [Clostridia bacterium]|nr:amidohydrolase family protein [Clostridia bacterium]